ncbi:MAG: HpsJ family protein [Desmonostoc vinosum HA7617-LM4]|jgi:ABC-type multidrug transport system fused ATPase/permease subunit|nr:HpsJ family protein [Desmonostoc vinosum HA7617-LM4]
MVNRFTSVSAAFTLKVVGIICILLFFADFVVFLLDFSPTNKQSQIVLATALVDRGIVPLIGLGLLFAAYWIDSADAVSDRPQGVDLRFPALILSSVLGLMFLLIFPLHLNNVRQFSTQTVTQITQRADLQENQLKAELNQVLTQLQTTLNTEQGKAQIEQFRNQARPQLKTQINDLLKDEKKYKQALDNPQVAPELKELLKKVKAAPQELDKELDKLIAQVTDPQGRATQKANQQLNLIRTQKEADEKQAKDGAWKSGLRIGISSLLLSIGYIVIGWIGLRGMGALQSGTRKATAR